MGGCARGEEQLHQEREENVNENAKWRLCEGPRWQLELLGAAEKA